MLENLTQNITTWASYALLGVFTILLVVFGVLQWLERKAQTKSKNQNIKYVHTPSQLFTVATKKRYDLLEQELEAKHGKTYGCWSLNAYTIVTTEPEVVQLVLNKEFTKFPNRRPFEVGDPIFKNFLFATNDDVWKRLRSIVTPTFSTGKLRKIKFCIDDTCHTLIDNFEKKINETNIVNIKQYVGGFTMDTIIQMAYGAKIDSLAEKDNPIITNVKKLFSTDLPLKDNFIFLLTLIAPTLCVKLGIRFNGDVVDFFHKMSLDIINKKREEIKSRGSIKPTNFIEFLLEAEQDAQNGNIESNGEGGKKSGKYISNIEIIAQCVLFFLVGYDTTATTITNTLYLLATHPEEQEKVYHELTELMEKLSQESDDAPADPFKLVTFESLPRFEYLTAAVSEALRLYPPATGLDRVATEDFRLETADGKIKFDVKKGDVVRVPIYSLHHHPDNFPDPESFKPERFLGEPTYHKFAYIPFGSGPRNCVARSLAMLEAKLAVLHLIRQYRFSPCKETKTPPEFYINADLLINKDIYLKVEKR